LTPIPALLQRITDIVDALYKCMILTYLLISSCCWDDALQKSPRLRRFKLDWDEIWQDYSSSKHASIDGVGFLIWRHNLKTAAMTSFHAEKCRRLVSALRRSVRHLFGR